MIGKKPYIIGVDVGGSKILIQVFDKKMNVLAAEKVETQVKKGEKGFLMQLTELIERHFSKNIKAIGLALPGIVQHEKGLLVQAPHLPTKKNCPIKKILEEHFSVPVCIENDINAFLLAESQRPTLQKYNNIVAIMIGTGVGGAILNDGKLVYGTNGYAGEVGHMIINAGGKADTLEKIIGGAYLPKLRDKKSVKAQLLKYLGIGLSNLNQLFNPEVIVLGGSVYHHYLSIEKKKLERFIASKSLAKTSPKIMDAGKQTSVAYGAALLAKQK